ncbi:MAG TPA: metal-binding protein [Gammaproteobacteria bacterium]|nr:metal-binding protein [Gammaproteobacteria bacterium]
MKHRFQNVFLASALCAGLSTPAFATEVTVYKSPTCGCCKQWVTHMQANGFTVKAHDVADIVQYKTANGVPMMLGSCHTAIVGGYVIEGHVPASDIRRLLKERPPVRGLAVPGMPVGSPGMEQGAHQDRYNVLTFDKLGNTTVYARH